ncbi:MAG: gamma carbonic anhydrase family protein [Ignavibacteriaceae bacterium]|nr:gamma carbonic anhydrase family protein [Ignavibacteriaceae bacterium]
MESAKSKELTLKTIISYKGISPKIDKSVFIADGVRITGDVEIGERSSIWFNTVIRADVNHVRIGSNTNIQDNATLHVSYDSTPLIIGDNVTVGHNAILHSCVVGNNVLIGMGAIVLDNTIIENFSMIAAGAMVRPHSKIETGKLYGGIPAKYIRDLTQDEMEYFQKSSDNYALYASDYMKEE